jgi:small subunit ribosomal protein S18
MAKKQKAKKKIIKVRPLSVNCMFCEDKTNPSYKNSSDMEKFVSDRGRIFNRERSGNCAKHQRILAREVKRARHLALLPFTGTIS